jgi:hypothetical protein
LVRRPEPDDEDDDVERRRDSASTKVATSRREARPSSTVGINAADGNAAADAGEGAGEFLAKMSSASKLSGDAGPGAFAPAEVAMVAVTATDAAAAAFAATSCVAGLGTAGGAGFGTAGGAGIGTGVGTPGTAEVGGLAGVAAAPTRRGPAARAAFWALRSARVGLDARALRSLRAVTFAASTSSRPSSPSPPNSESKAFVSEEAEPSERETAKAESGSTRESAGSAWENRAGVGAVVRRDRSSELGWLAASARRSARGVGAASAWAPAAMPKSSSKLGCGAAPAPASKPDCATGRSALRPAPAED